MEKLMLVGLGGGVGAIARFLVGQAVGTAAGHPRFPLGTLTVNLVGCLIIGLLAGLGEQRQVLTDEMRLLVVTGVLGGFTTFSAFGVETFTLLRTGQWSMAALNVLLSVGVGLVAVWGGWRLGLR